MGAGGGAFHVSGNWVAAEIPAMSPIRLYAADAVQDSLESLFAAHGPQRSHIYWCILLGVAAGLAALPLVKVEVSVRAQGMVRPQTERAELKSAVAGHITEVLARDNDAVHAGQPLLVLRGAEVEERLARNRARQAEQREALADLDWLVGERPSGSTVSPATALLAVEPVFASSRNSTLPKGSATGVSFSTAQYRQEFTQLQAQLHSYALAEQRARGELDRYTALAAKGIVTQQELDNARYEFERLRAEKALAAEQTLARWQATLREGKSTLANLVTEEQRFTEELAHYTLRASASGALIGFAGLSVGSFVAAGQVLGAVSPDDALRVEALVTPKDVGLIRVGQTARLQIDAFPYTQWGTIDGIVESISGDMLNGGPSAASGVFFKVIVRPASTTLRLPSGVAAELRKGMTLSARFLVARRSLLQILHEDVSNWLDPKANPAA